MKERVESAEKKKVTLHLSVEAAKYIHDRAYPHQTQSRYVEDLVERDGRVEKLDLVELANILRHRGEGWVDGIPDEEMGKLIDDILSIFGIEKAGG